jgi:hypothetical protein
MTFSPLICGGYSVMLGSAQEGVNGRRLGRVGLARRAARRLSFTDQPRCGHFTDQPRYGH